MTEIKLMPLEDNFINQLKQQKTPTTVFLMNGVKLQGFVTAFDSSSVILARDDQLQMVYKHAISTIMPSSQAATISIAD